MAELKKRLTSLQLQPRDVNALRGLFEARVMTTDHLSILFFNGKREYTKKRLQKLKAAGFIGERKRNANEPSVLFLTRKAFSLLASRGELSGYPPLGTKSFEARANVSDLTLLHEIEVMDVRTAFHAALAKSDKFSIIEFSTWPLLHQFEMSHPEHGADVLVKPDGFISIHEKEIGTKGYSHDCFLEVDRSSEKQDALVNKAVCYLRFFKSGGFAVRNGSTCDKFKEFPFRVLIVLKSAERRNNTAERLLQNNPPILTQTWLTTFDEVTADPLGAIWIQPKDYREVTTGTQFDTAKPNRNFAYRRQREREMFVEERIKKRRLLEV
jgi:hypothetical protein